MIIQNPGHISLLAAVISLAFIMSESDLLAANYDESKVPDYVLPEILVTAAGAPVDSAEQWEKTRRPEILKLFENHVYGTQPGEIPVAVYEQILHVADALDGRATLREIRIHFPEINNSPEIFVLLWTPNKGQGPFPGFAGLNFNGNHTTHADPRIRIPTGWVRSSNDGTVVNNRATEAGRGRSAGRWPVEKIINRGYALATAYCGDIDPDFHDGFKNGVHAMFPSFKTGASGRDPEAWGTIAGWAWGLSRIMDLLDADSAFDSERIAVIGHSRLGKTSLWAGATDTRFGLVISNNSGCGGAALSRRAFGETVARINTSFPHWFCDRFKEYNDNESALPVDQHMLLALMAPRPVYVASAEDDRWADPKGEFLALRNAAGIYRLFEKDPVDSDSMPEVNQPVHKDTGYHIRSGKHDINDYDWTQYLDFADKHFR